MIDLATARASGGIPRVHGNGFIQLDLTERSRLHVWGDPRIPRQKVSTQIHDHVFGFESTIVVGRLVNVCYRFVPRSYGDFRVYVPVMRVHEDTLLKPTDVVGCIAPLLTEVIDRNTTTRTYWLRPFLFHESLAPDGPAATVITKTGPTQAQGSASLPRVLVPIDKVPDNDFTRYDADEDLLWRIIEQTLKGRTR